MAKKQELQADRSREIREGLMDAMGRVSDFWGFNRLMGRLYGLLYLSSGPMGLDEMAQSLGVSKGSISLNIRALERWNMVKPVWMMGDRKDYYEAETDFWKIARGVLREREKKEFSEALVSVGELKDAAKAGGRKDEETAYILERLEKLEDFIRTMDKLVSVMLTFEDLKRNFMGLQQKK